MAIDATTDKDVADSLSALPQAVAALHLKQAGSIDTTKDNKKPPSLSSGTDSGYSSGPNSGLPTPEKSPEGSFPNEFLRTSTARRLFPGLAKSQTSKVFNRPVIHSVQTRFDDLSELFGPSLEDHLLKARVDSNAKRNISIKLKLVGLSEDTASPCIIILCDKATSRSVKQFFGKDQVKSQYQPQEPSLDTPHFDIKVCHRPPRQIAIFADVNIECYTKLSGLPAAVVGASLTVPVIPDGNRLGTLGGLVLGESTSGAKTLYGMSVGHIFPPDKEYDSRIPSLRSEVDGATENAMEEGSNDDELFPEFDGFDIDFEFDEDTDQASAPVIDVQSTVSEVSVRHDFRHVPQVQMRYAFVRSGDTSTHHVGDLDWSLLEIDNIERFLPFSQNVLMGMKLPREAICAVQRNLKVEKRVTAFCGVSGRQPGVLSPTMSRLMLGSSAQFVHTYNLTLSSGSVLQPGDCGSWVMDEATSEVYGHVVASDAFGEAYVVPLRDTIQDIQARLNSKTVRLPTAAEILKWYAGRELPQPADSGYSSMTTSPLHSAPSSPHHAVERYEPPTDVVPRRKGSKQATGGRLTSIFQRNQQRERPGANINRSRMVTDGDANVEEEEEEESINVFQSIFKRVMKLPRRKGGQLPPQS